MSIKRIAIVTDGGTVEVSGSFTLSAASPVAADASGSSAVLSAPGVLDMYAEAYDRLTGLDRYVSRINGAGPAADGAAMIDGDGCLSWTVAGDPEDSDSSAHVTLYDLCAACESCDTHARLVRRLEQCKIALNTLKDVNLYADGDVKTRRSWLVSRKAELADSCLGDDSSSYSIFSSMLLRQYVAMVHMWNYAVSTRNNSDDIEVAPDTPCGIAVRTRYAMPDCRSGSALRLSVNISPSRLADGQENVLSAYIPDVECSYSPFDGASITVTKTSGHTSGSVDVVFDSIASAGTAVVLLKFIPFVCLNLAYTDGRALRNVRDVVQNTAVDTGDGDIDVEDALDESGSAVVQMRGTRLRTGVVATIVQKTDASKSDYDTSAGYPSVSCAGSNVWRIEISWTVTGSNARTVSNTYLFSAAPARVPVYGLMNDDIDLAKVNGT